jgi:hypothetical protein
MPIPIIIAMLIALFTLGAIKHQKGSPAQVVIIGGKPYYRIDKKEDRNTLVVLSGEKRDHSVTIKGQRETEPFENIFQLSGLYQIIKTEPMSVINNSINSNNMKQAICLSEKE